MLILGIVGSLRAESYNRRLLRQAATLLPSGVTWHEWGGLAELPPFNADDEDDPGSDVQTWQAAIADADAVLIATPEYNGSIPGLLKNAVDWASRPPGAGVLTDKNVAVIGASPSRYGAAWAQAELRKVLGNAGARVLDRELPITRADQALTPDGRLTDPAAAEKLSDILGGLIAMSAPGCHCTKPGELVGAT